MVRQLSILLFLLVLLSCKNDSLDLGVANFVSIAGTWRLKEIEQGNFGQKYWAMAAAKPDRKLIFREDGVVLDHDSLGLCCGPVSLLINGRLFEIKPATPIAANPICALVECAACPEWDIKWKENEMVILYCNGSKEKYLRL